MIIVRYAEIEDIEGMADVHLKTWRTTYSGIISEDFLSGLENKKDERINRSKSNFGKLQVDGSKIYQAVVIDGEKIIGIATYGRYRGKETEISNSGEIYSIYILKEYQGQGIGKQLINFAVKDLVSEGYDNMVVWSLKDNPSVGFYKSIGGDERLTGNIVIGGQVLDEIGFVYDDLHELLKVTEGQTTKKWIAISGSPRRGRNTEKLMDYYIEELETLGKDVEKVILSEIELNICIGCEECIKNNCCHYDDDISMILEKMKDAEGIILSSPSWHYNVSSYMKIFLDRMFCMFNFGKGSWSSELGSREIKSILIGACAGPGESSMGYTIEAMRGVMSDHGVEVLIEEAYCGTKRNPVGDNQDIKDNIRRKVYDNIRGLNSR